jgi:hypothetical protein
MATCMMYSYYDHIQDIDSTVKNNTQDIMFLKSNVSIIQSILQKENPNINLDAYMNVVKKRGITTPEIVHDLDILGSSTPEEGKNYLIRQRGFSSSDVDTIFFLPRLENKP